MRQMSKRLIPLVAALLLALVVAGSGFAQKKDKAPTERSIAGIVTLDDDTPVAGAVVQLKNMKTLQVRSFIAREKGDYIFQGLSMDVDFELKAMANGKESNARTVSTFDPHPTVTVHLKLK
jgi:hypothetical protein